MSIARLISSDIVTQQRIFGVSVYILISFLLCTIAEQKFLSSCFRWSSQLNDEPFLFTTALRETRMNADRYKRGIKDDIFYHNNEENIGGVAPRPRSEATRRNDNVNTTTATTSSTINDKGNDARWRRRGVSDDDQPQYHEISPLLSCFNITLTDVGIHPQDHIRVFFSENSMCNDAPPDDLKIVRSPTATSIDTFSSRNLSSIGAVNANKSSSSTTPKHQQRFLRHQNVTSSQRIAIAIMVPHGQCSLEQKLQHIVKWYQNDHPDVKVVMFYDPPSLPHLVSSVSSNTPSSRPTTVVLDDDTVTASKRNNQRNPPSFSSYTSEHSSSTYINTDLSSARGSAIVPFNISQRTATSFKNMINDANQFVDVRMIFPYYAASIVTNSRTTERNLSERLSFKERILALIEDIFASMIVTILSLVVTGILLLLCWKDALSIEITADGVLIISNVSYVDDSSHNMMEDQQRATLSTELVLAFPEVTFASHSGRINQASRRMPPSPRTSQQRQQRHFDEESPLPLLPAGGGAEQVKSEQIKFPAEKLPCFCCNTTCSICLEDFTPDETLRLLPCGHIFHTSCILPWLTKRATSCPLCKKCLHCDL